jgi:hypothetical protein
MFQQQQDEISETILPFVGNVIWLSELTQMADDRQQWNLLKRQFDKLVRDEAASYNSIDDMLDDAIRRRFAKTLSELITTNSRTQHRSKTREH